MRITRREALRDGTATVAAAAIAGAGAVNTAVGAVASETDPVVALRAERLRILDRIHEQPDTVEGELLCSELISDVCRLEVQILETEPQTVAGALCHVEQLCQWEENGVVVGGDVAIRRLIKVLPERIELLTRRASS